MHMNAMMAYGHTDDQATTTMSDPTNTPDPAPLLDMLDLDAVSEDADPDVLHKVGGLVVNGTDAQESKVELEPLCRLALKVMAGEGIERGRIDVHLVTREVIADLNRDYLSGHGPTDVVAFPLDPDEFVAPSADSESPPLLGDVVVCPAVAIAQAPEHAGSVEAELSLLVVHGVLHVLGHDHLDDKEAAVMQGKERAQLARLGYAHPIAEP